MEVGLIIQGKPPWDFLELISGSCVWRTPRGSVLPSVAGQSGVASQSAYHAPPWASIVGEGKMKGAFFLPQVSPTSILQNST
jgi:hypothetical protein